MITTEEAYKLSLEKLEDQETRQIKFKFWDKDNKEWISGSEIEFQESGQPFNLYGKNIIYLQFTGLKDKNNKEIYEGDIVKLRGYRHYNLKNGAKKYGQRIKEEGKEDSAMFVQIEEVKYIIKNGKSGFNCCFSLWTPESDDDAPYSHEIEIIGNIFEKEFAKTQTISFSK